MPNSATVLVASDDAFELATLSASLRLHSINVVAEAHTEEIAENLYKFLSPKVVLIDLQLKHTLKKLPKIFINSYLQRLF